MSTEPTRAEERRLQLVDAALRVIVKRGFDRTRLVDVAEEAGVSVGLVQHYFHRRDALLRASFAEAVQRTLAGFDAIAAAEPDPLPRLVDLLREAVLNDRWPIWLEFWAAGFREPSLRRQSADAYDRWVEVFRTTISDGVATGAFEPRSSAQDVADRLVAEIDGMSMRTLLEHISRERAIELLIQQLEEELGAELRVHTRSRRDG